VLGTVVYSEPRLGMGISFTQLTPEQKSILENWLAEAAKNGCLQSYDPAVKWNAVRADACRLVESRRRYWGFPFLQQQSAQRPQVVQDAAACAYMRGKLVQFVVHQL
jgi:hypothetical protein